MYRWHDLPRLVGLTIIYAVLAHLVLIFSFKNGNLTIFWAPGGLALAALLLWGTRFWLAIFLGALIAGINVGDTWFLSALIAAGNTLETVCAALLLHRLTNFNLSFTEITHYLTLTWVAALCTVISAVIGPIALLKSGFLSTDNLFESMLHWWQADLLGILLVTPLILIWRHWPYEWFKRTHLINTLLFFLANFIVGQIMFMGWFDNHLGSFVHSYWTFLFMVWAAVIYGRHGALLIVALTTMQALAGVTQKKGLFSADLVATQLENFWFFILALTVVGISLAINIEARKQKEHDLQDSENRFRLFLNHNPFIAWIKDEMGQYVYVNETMQTRFNFQADGWINKTDFEIWPETTAQQFRANDLKTLNTWQSAEHLEETQDANGNPNFWSTVKFPFQDSYGRRFTGGIGVDVTERKIFEEKQRLTARIFENTLEGIIITDADRNIIDINAAFTKITGYSREEVMGKNPRFLKSGVQNPEYYQDVWASITTTGHWSGEIWNRRKDGILYPEWITISALTDQNGQTTHYVGISSDISLLKQHEKRLEQIAHYDALTGIPNRVLLVDRMQQALAKTHREKKLLAIGYLDLDGFKLINDTLGHDAGDNVLIEIANRISRTLRSSDTVARLGGDEFVILLLGIENADECNQTLDRLLSAISHEILLEGQSFTITASIGVTLYPHDDQDPDTLLRHADQAMYLAKQLGKSRYHIFDPHEDVRLKAQSTQRKLIEEGFLAAQFELYYQPKVTLADRQIVGAEALIRWNHPTRGVLSPMQFLPHIENTNLDIQLGEWVIAKALQQIASWNSAGIALEVSINISAHHLQSAMFVANLKQQLQKYPALEVHQLQIEILETAALNDIAKVSSIIAACGELGVSFALDDFGIGYSSLAYLRRLPANTLKIDQSFVRDMLFDKEDRAIIKGIIALARTFNRTTIAEGVETDAHFDLLREMGCDIGQGYGIARPMPATEIQAWCQKFIGSVNIANHQKSFHREYRNIHWSTKFEIGHDRIDSEHRIFLGLIIAINKEINTTNERHHISQLLEELAAYAKFHFVSEENIMAAIAYPDLEAHAMLHKQLIANLTELKTGAHQPDIDYPQLVDFLFEWFSIHTATEDKKIAQFITHQAE